MDPNALLPITQVGGTGAGTLATIVSAFAIGIGFAVRWWSNHAKRDSADGVVLANDGVIKAAAVSVETAIQIQGAMIADLRAQMLDMTQRVQAASDQRNAADSKVSDLQRAVANLQAQLSDATNSNSRLIARVQVLEDLMHAAGLPIPPDHQ